MGRLILARRGAAVALTLLASQAVPVRGQSRDRIRTRCAAATDASEATCLQGALAVAALQGGVALALSGGSELPGSPSTLGHRFGSTPRWALAGRLGLVQFDHPAAAGSALSGSEGDWVPSLQAEAALGLFDGFHLAPTVGGFLSVDLLGTWGVAFLPGGSGFDGATSAWGYGARVGILRESFTLPAVTLSLARRHGGGFDFGDEGDAGVAVEGLKVTSVRATVGKEFLALGVLAGMGWERVDGHGSLRTFGTSTGPVRVVEYDGARDDRILVFGALTRTWLVFQATAEGGFATGYDARPDGFSGDYDPSGGSIFGSLSFRAIF